MNHDDEDDDNTNKRRRLLVAGPRLFIIILIMNHDDEDDDNTNKRRRLLVAAVAASFFSSNNKAKKFTSGSRMKRRSNPDYPWFGSSNIF